MNFGWPSMSIEKCAWNTLVSAHKEAELKYKNVVASLRYGVGYDKPVDWRKKLVPIRSKRKSFLQEMEEKCGGFEFKSIPDVTFLPQSGLLVASEFASVNHEKGRVTVFGLDGKPVTKFPLEDEAKDVYLFGISSLYNCDDTVAICTGDGISLWNVDGRRVAQFTHCNVQNCCHVTGMQNGLLATTCVTDMSGRCVTLWDPRSGTVTSQFGSKPEIIEINPLKGRQTVLIRSQDLRMPWFITSDSQSNILISDRKDQSIKVFDSRSGRFKRRFDTAGVNTRCRKGSLLPQGICCDEDDNVFVSDDVTKSIAVFDRHGEHVTNFPLDLDARYCHMWSLAMSSLSKDGLRAEGRRNPKISPPRKLALSLSYRKPRLNVYNLSFCRHYSVGF